MSRTPRTTVNIQGHPVPRLHRIAGAMQVRDRKRVTLSDVVNILLHRGMPEMEKELSLPPSN